MSTAPRARRRLIRSALACTLAPATGPLAGLVPTLLAGPARAQPAFPNRPLRIVVAGPAGASADLVARLFAEPLARLLGQPAIVDPRPGGAGAIAVGELANATHDGHTLLVGVSSLVSEIPHIVKTRFDMATQLRPLAELARGGLVLVASPAFPARTLAELVTQARSRPGAIAYASYSPGTMSHVLGLLLNRAAGIELNHVGYKGSTPALADVTAGHVPLMFDGLATSLPLLRAGRLRALAISSPQRSPALPEVPTFAELGYPALQATAWMGLWCSPDVPAAVQARVRAAALEVGASTAVRDRLLELGFEAGRPLPTDTLLEGLRADHQRVGDVLKSIDFKPD